MRTGGVKGFENKCHKTVLSLVEISAIPASQIALLMFTMLSYFFFPFLTLSYHVF
jgi:hypothetical protein